MMEIRVEQVSAGTGNEGAAPLPPPRCANCGAEKAGTFCQECGQKHADVALSLRSLARDFVDEYLSADSRLFRSVLYLCSASAC